MEVLSKTFNSVRSRLFFKERIRGLSRGQQQSQVGFSLIEVLLVLVIVGMMAFVVVLNLPERSRAPTAAELSRIFLLKFNHAREMALLKNQILGLEIKEQSYRYLIWQGRAWQVGKDKFFQENLLDENFRLDFIPGEFDLLLNEPELGTGSLFGFAEDKDKQSDESPQPQVIIFSSGEFTPFRMQWFHSAELEPKIQLDGSNGLHLQEVENALW